MRLIICALVSLVAGVLLGCIPFVNEHLHWNFWIVIPVSGLVLGAVFGWLQFFVAKTLQARIGTVGAVVLTLVGGLSYFGTDLGIWLTRSVESEKGQTVALRDAISFADFEAMRFTQSSISRRGQEVRLGTVATIATAVVDELGALIGAAAVLFGMAASAPYCKRCSRYRQEHLTVAREFPLDPAYADPLWQWLTQQAAARQYTPIAMHLQSLNQLNIASRRKVTIAETICPKCGQGELEVSLHKHGKQNEWEAEGKSLTVESGPNEAPRLVATPAPFMPQASGM